MTRGILSFSCLALLALTAAGCGPAQTTNRTALPATAAHTGRPAPTPAQRVHTVAISAGHGGPNNVGATHRDDHGRVDLVEKDLNLDVARRLDALLRAAGYRTVLIRDGDYSLVPDASPSSAAGVRAESQVRADAANAAGADIVLAVHHNGSADPAQSGTEVYYNPDRSFGEASRVLATAVYDAILARLRELGYEPRPRGVLNDSLTAAARFGDDGDTFLLGESPGFRATQMPGMIGESLFVSNDGEAALLQRDDVRQAIAQAYKDGIDAYFSWLRAQQRQ